MKPKHFDRMTRILALLLGLSTSWTSAAPVPGSEELSEENLFKKPVIEIPESLEPFVEGKEGASLQNGARDENLSSSIRSPLLRRVGRLHPFKNSSAE
jgi:hypothetical protein